MPTDITTILADVLALITGILTTASIIAKFTPTPKDDEYIKQIILWLSVFRSNDDPATFKPPFSK